ncbi:MAG: ACT domain-containing protein [Actinomycetota bacterium]
MVALGGYGRRLLCPGSDVDLMVLHAERKGERVRRAAEQVFYPFWDAGIPLGHAVRTVGESLSEAGDRLDVVCSLLDARPVAGDPALVEELGRKLRSNVAKQRGRWIEGLAADAAARHGGPAACSTSLEPDLKEGSGGLRDIHAVGWIEAIASAADGLVRADERQRLDEAEEFLVRLRSALHLLTGKRPDRLFREHQGDLAPAFGFDATAGLDAADALMRGLFEHGRHVEHVRTLVLERARDPGTTSTKTLPPPPTSPEGVMETLVALARSDTSPPAGWLDALDAADLGERPFVWTDGMLSSFLELLALGDRGVAGLEVLDRAELLAGYFPEWAPVRCRPQRDPYHRYTVDVHLARTVANTAGRLLARDAADETLDAAAEAVTDRDALLLGAFLHDIGKTGEGRHVMVGERVASEVIERMGVPEATGEVVLFLVREHLLLSETATRRDLSDVNLVLDVAARIGDPERLAMLYLLTVADAEATGPHASTPWRLGLVRELVGRVEHALEGEMDRELAGELASRMERLRALLGSEPPAAVDAYLARLPRPYLLAVAAEEAAVHFSLLWPSIGSGEVRTTAKEGSRHGTWELTVVAADRPGLLARMAGSLALAGLSILSAQAFTTEDGVAIDLFVVEPAYHGDIDEERWRVVRQTLRKALEGRLSLEYRVREKRRHYPRPAADVPSEVRVLNDVSDFATVVEVEAADRLGLLFDLARTFEELHLDVSLAKVGTYGPRVVDTFYVRDLYGEKIEDREHAEEVRRAILSRLAEGG